MARQALGDYKDLLLFFVNLPDQVAPIVVETLSYELDNLWEEMDGEEREEAAQFNLQLVFGREE